MRAAVLIHIEDLFVDATQRAALYAMFDAARADAQRRANAERVDLRARRQQIGDGELVQVATGEDTHAAHARLRQLRAHVLAIRHDVAAIQPHRRQGVAEVALRALGDRDRRLDRLAWVVGIQQQRVAVEGAATAVKASSSVGKSWISAWGTVPVASRR